MKNKFDFLNDFEGVLIDMVAKIAPWCAPLPTAYLVGRATIQHLHWPVVIGISAASVIESLGLVTTATALDLYQYNRSKRKVDPRTPFGLAISLVGMYFMVAIGLTVFLDIAPNLTVYAPGIFPVLSLVGVTVIALRSNLRRQVAEIQAERQERKAKRQVLKPSLATRETSTSKSESKSETMDTIRERLQEARRKKQQSRQSALLNIFNDHPDLTITEAAQSLGFSRQTVYTYLEYLEKQGQIRRNGHGVEVLK